jgi:hypothetical protein
MSTDERDTYDSHSPIEDKEFSAGRPPLGHDDPVAPNPHRDDPDEGDAMSTEEPEAPEVDEPDDDETEEESQPE